VHLLPPLNLTVSHYGAIMKILLTKEELVSQISILLDDNPHNTKVKISKLLHRAKNHAEQHKEKGNTVLAFELKNQVEIGFGFINSGVLDKAGINKEEYLKMMEEVQNL